MRHPHEAYMPQERAPHRAPMGWMTFHAMILALITVALLISGCTAYAMTDQDHDSTTVLSSVRTTLAASNQSGDWEYTVNAGSNTITLDKYLGSDAVIEIDTVDGYEVSGLGDALFKDNTTITKVSLPSSITEIGDDVFVGCTNLTTVNLTQMEEVRTLGGFKGCTSLASVIIPACVQSLDESAFDGCTALASVAFQDPSSLSVIGSRAFKGCKLLESFEMPYNMVSIGDEAFVDCESLATVVLDGSALQSIGESAFSGCSALQAFHFPDAIQSVGGSAFAWCTSLTRVSFGRQLPSSFGEAFKNVFEGCSALDMMVFPKNTSVNSALQFGWKIHMVKLDVQYNDGNTAGITDIHTPPDHAPVTLPAKVGNSAITAIHSAAALNNSTLTGVVFPEDTQISRIADHAFLNCTAMKSIVIPSSVTSIETGAFRGCTALENIEFKTESLVTFEGATFADCTSLKSIELPEGLTTLTGNEFLNCTSLETVNLPSTLTYMGPSFLTDNGKKMPIKTMRMPDSNKEVDMPNDHDFMSTWEHPGKAVFEVTYGSWSDYIWFEQHLDNAAFTEQNRRYVPVDIARTDGSVDLQIINPDSDYTRSLKLPEVTGKRWYRSIFERDPVTGRVADCAVVPASGYDCVSVGEQKAIIWGQEPHFTGSITAEFQITPKDVFFVTASAMGPYTWDNGSYEPVPTVTLKIDDLSYELVQNEDFYIDKNEGYKNNWAPGEGTVTINGMGNFAGAKDFHFTIEKASLEKEAEVSPIPDQHYTGSEIKPVPAKVRLMDRTGEYSDDLVLSEGDHYKLSYRDNTEVGQATAILTGVGDFVKGSKEVTFNIVSGDLSKATIADVPDQVYTGTAITPALRVSLGDVDLVEGRDYSVTWKGNVNVGTARGTVKGIEPYCTGERAVEFDITPKPATVTADSLSKAYGENDPTLTASVSGTVGTDTLTYTLARETGENAGKYAIAASGDARQGNYAVTFKDGVFTINQASMTDAVVGSVDSVTYDGAAYTPEPSVIWSGRTLEKDVDYTLSYANNTAAGEATVSVQGKGNFKDEVDVRFDILALDLRREDVNVLVPFKVHTGIPLEPHPAHVTAQDRSGAVFTLEEGADYEVTGWRDNLSVGTGYVTIRGTGSCCETREDPFNIVNDGDLSQGYMSEISEQVYTGGSIEPELRVFLKGVDLWLVRDVDYTAVFTDNVNAGTAKVTVTGLGDISGSLDATFNIGRADISQAVVAVPEQTYGGAPLTPVPTVTWNEMLLEEGKDYKVAGFQDNVHAGTATVTVTGDGNFEGTATGVFSIAKRPLTVRADSATREYDGSPLTDAGFTGEGLAAGDAVASAKVEGSQTDAGSCANVVSDAKVENAAYEDVTRDYDISYKEGLLTVEPLSERVTVSISGQAATVVYDGAEHEVAGYAASIDNVLYKESDFSFSGSALVAGTDAGSYAMGLAIADFANKSVNFSNVAFTVEDGVLAIEPASIGSASVAAIEAVIYDGTAHRPKPTVKWKGQLLELGKDYSLSWSHNIDAGKGSVSIRGNGNFKEETTASFDVLPANIAEVAEVTAPNEVYDGTAHTPAPTVTWSKTTLEEGVDYDVLGYEGNVRAGTASVVVRGRGNFAGEALGTFEIARRPLTIAADSAVREYDGLPLTVAGFTSEGLAAGDAVASAKVEGSQTDAGISANVVSDAVVENAVGDNVTADYDIVYAEGVLEVTPYAKRVTVTVTGNSASAVYDGKEHEAAGYEAVADVDLFDETDIAFSGVGRVRATNVGTYALGLSDSDFANGSANFTDVAFTVRDGALAITPASIADVDMASISDRVYDGAAHKPALSLTWNGKALVAGVDYAVSYSDNVHAGTAKAVVRGSGNFVGEVAGSFKITRRLLVVAADSARKQYDGLPLEAPGYTVEGLAVGDEVSAVAVQGARTDAGSSKNVVSGASVSNAASEDVTADYGITYAEGELVVEPFGGQVTVAITGNSSSFTYDGDEHEARGYAVAIDNALYDGSWFVFTGDDAVTATDAGSYPLGLSVSDFANTSVNFANVVFEVEDGALEIAPASLSEAGRFEISPIPSVAYDGSAHEPKPVVRDAVVGSTLAESADYALSYRNNVEVGTASVEIAGKGNYDDTVRATFEIVGHTVTYSLVRGPSGPIDVDGDTAVEFEFERSEDAGSTFDHFELVSVDGYELGASDCSVRRGSVIIALKPTFLKTLASGEHEIAVMFDDGGATAEFEIAGPGPGPKPGPKPGPAPNPTPGTGDGGGALAGMLALAALASGLLAWRIRKRMPR